MCMAMRNQSQEILSECRCFGPRKHNLFSNAPAMTEASDLANGGRFLWSVDAFRKEMNRLAGEFDGRVFKVEGKRIPKGGMRLMHE